LKRPRKRTKRKLKGKIQIKSLNRRVLKLPGHPKRKKIKKIYRENQKLLRRKNTNLNQRRNMFKLHKLKYSLLLILNRFRKMTLKYRRTNSLIFHQKEVAPKI